jgi:glycosyltransferase
MNVNNPKISIITTALNSQATIEKTIQSVLAQDYKNIEYIIIDGKSTDKTLDIAKNYEKHIDKIISEPDTGIYNAMNKGIKAATGDIIATINSDDFYTDNTVATRMVNHIKQNSLDAAFANLLYVHHKNTSKIVRFWKATPYKPGDFQKGWVPPHPTFFCQKKIFNQFGLFREDFQVAADFELMLRFIEKYKIKTGHLQKTIVKMRTGGKANIIKGIIKGNFEIYKAFKINNIPMPLSYFPAKPFRKIKQLINIKI